MVDKREKALSIRLMEAQNGRYGEKSAINTPYEGAKIRLSQKKAAPIRLMGA